MHVRKAVITAAGRGIRLYPASDTVQKGMLPLVDRDGLAKPAIQIIAEEALESGIEEICIVCAPGDENRYRTRLARTRDNILEAFGGADWAAAQAARLDKMMRALHFAVQEEPLGYGHAVYCAREFTAGEPFLLLLGDHVYVSHEPERRCAQQLLDLAAREGCAVAAVHATREHLIRHYGTVSGRRVGDARGVYRIERMIEKPPISIAEIELQTPGLRVGQYLCLFGMHIMTPSIFALLEEDLASENGGNGGVQLTPALQRLARRETYLAAELHGVRHDLSAKYGMVQAQVALGMAGQDRDTILSGLLELLADDARTGRPS